MSPRDGREDASQGDQRPARCRSPRRRPGRLPAGWPLSPGPARAGPGELALPWGAAAVRWYSCLPCPERQRSGPLVPDQTLPSRVRPWLPSRAEPRPRLQHHPHSGVSPHRAHLPEQHDVVRSAGKRQRLAALDHGATGHPPAPPDQAARLVVAAPHVPGVRRGNRVCPAAADQRGEHRVRIPPRRAHPDQIPVRADQPAPLTVRHQRVLPQYLRAEADRITVIARHVCLLPVPTHSGRNFYRDTI